VFALIVGICYKPVTICSFYRCRKDKNVIKVDIDEIIRIAEEIEETGAAFYRKAAELYGGNTEKFFLVLAKVEDAHRKTFAAMRREKTDSGDMLATFDADDGAGLYLEYSIKSEVFCKDPAEVITGKESAVELVDFAIDREKDSIIFYKSMKDAVTLPADQAVIENIIKEEYGHLLALTEIIVRITSGDENRQRGFV